MKALINFFLLISLLPYAVIAAELGKTQDVVINTSKGQIEIELYVEKAPISAGDFVRYLELGLVEKMSFTRTVTKANDKGSPNIEVIQAGLIDSSLALTRVAHESTAITGLAHTDGALSLARSKVGTGTASTFFITIGEQPSLDHGGERIADGKGFAVFGKVTKGMGIVRVIHQLEANKATDIAYIKGQLLTEPVLITGAYIK